MSVICYIKSNYRSIFYSTERTLYITSYHIFLNQKCQNYEKGTFDNMHWCVKIDELKYTLYSYSECITLLSKGDRDLEWWLILLSHLLIIALESYLHKIIHVFIHVQIEAAAIVQTLTNYVYGVFPLLL